VNDYGTFIPPAAAEDFNCGRAYGVPVDIRDVDLVHCIEAAVWIGPIPIGIVWRKDPNGTPRASEGIREGRSHARVRRNGEVIDIWPDRREGERLKGERSQLDEVVDGAIANSHRVTEYLVRYADLHLLFFTNLVFD
jgi:hypothetical protein